MILQHNRLCSQARNEDLRVTSEQALDEAVLSFNASIAVHGTTPYEALFGRVSTLLRDISSRGPALDGISGGSSSKHVHRFRELSLAQIVQSRSEARLKVAEGSRRNLRFRVLC